MAEKERKGVANYCLGKKINLKGSVEYSEGSVVSKTLIDKDAGTLTLFSFDAGQGLSTHSAPYDAAVEVLDGRVEITIGDDVHELTKGDFIVMPADVPHGLKAIEKFKMLLIMIREK